MGKFIICFFGILGGHPKSIFWFLNLCFDHFLYVNLFHLNHAYFELCKFTLFDQPLQRGRVYIRKNLTPEILTKYMHLVCLKILTRKTLWKNCGKSPKRREWPTLKNMGWLKKGYVTIYWYSIKLNLTYYFSLVSARWRLMSSRS